MSIILQSILNTLQKAQVVLNCLSNQQLCDVSVPPYYSSIGTHIRHILDFYDCIFRMDGENRIDLTARSRSREVEKNCNCAKEYLEMISLRLNSAKFNISDTVLVVDDLGLGETEIPYTYGALLAQANSHTIHHYAIINYIFDSLRIEIADFNFGYNPTTPKQTSV